MKPIESAEEALAILNATRSELIRAARQEAAFLCLKHGRTNSREVRESMKVLGLLEDSTDERWLGAVFKCPLFEATGETLMVEDRERNIHRGRANQIWALTPSARAAFKNLL